MCPFHTTLCLGVSSNIPDPKLFNNSVSLLLCAVMQYCQWHTVIIHSTYCVHRTTIVTSQVVNACRTLRLPLLSKVNSAAISMAYWMLEGESEKTWPHKTRHLVEDRKCCLLDFICHTVGFLLNKTQRKAVQVHPGCEFLNTYRWKTKWGSALLSVSYLASKNHDKNHDNLPSAMTTAMCTCLTMDNPSDGSVEVEDKHPGTTTV